MSLFDKLLGKPEPAKEVSRSLDSADPVFPAGAPLAPSAPPSILQEQPVGSEAWQLQKLVREERRLDALAKKAANNQMAAVAAGKGTFGVTAKGRVLEEDYSFVDPTTGETVTIPAGTPLPQIVLDMTAPAPHFVDEKFLEDERNRSRDRDYKGRPGPHLPTRMPREQFEARRRNQRRVVDVSFSPKEVPHLAELVRQNKILEDPEVRSILAEAGADLSRGTIDVLGSFGDLNVGGVERDRFAGDAGASIHARIRLIWKDDPLRPVDSGAESPQLPALEGSHGSQEVHREGDQAPRAITQGLGRSAGQEDPQG